MVRKIFEHTSQPLQPTIVYLRRQFKFLFGALVFIGIALGIGTLGYMHYAHFAFPDAFLNASMILSGMGPVDALPNDAAKYFASGYALFSGIALISTVAVVLAPLVHRFLHAMHLDEKD
jgi:hypothetical protein